jgi:hypothetical protein
VKAGAQGERTSTCRSRGKGVGKGKTGRRCRATSVAVLLGRWPNHGSGVYQRDRACQQVKQFFISTLGTFSQIARLMSYSSKACGVRNLAIDRHQGDSQHGTHPQPPAGPCDTWAGHQQRIVQKPRGDIGLNFARSTPQEFIVLAGRSRLERSLLLPQRSQGNEKSLRFDRRLSRECLSSEQVSKAGPATTANLMHSHLASVNKDIPSSEFVIARVGVIIVHSS